MAAVTIGIAALGAVASIAAAGYQASTGFAARHEVTHAQQIETTKRYITEFEVAYEKGEVSEEDWKEYLLIRDKARDSEKAYEDSINEYKDTPIFNLITKWKQRKQVRKRKRKLRQSNRELRSHYDGWSSGASDASSISAAHGSPPRSRAKTSQSYGRISNWLRDVASSESGSESESESEPEPDNCARWERVPHDPRCLYAMEIKDVPKMLSFSPDSKRIACVVGDEIKIWDMHGTQMSAEPLVWRAHGVECISFSPDGKSIVSGSVTEAVCIWDAHTGRRTVGPLSGASRAIMCVAFSPDGRMVASVSASRHIGIWDSRTGKTISSRRDRTSYCARSVEFSPDSKSIISTSTTGNVYFRDIKMSMKTWILRREFDQAVIKAVFHPSGKRLLSVSWDGSINSWNLNSKVPMTAPKKIHPSPSCVSFSEDCSFVVSSSSDLISDYLDIVITDVSTGESIAEPLRGHTMPVTCLAVSADRRWAASAAWDITIRIWDIDTCRRKYVVEERAESVQDV